MFQGTKLPTRAAGLGGCLDSLGFSLFWSAAAHTFICSSDATSTISPLKRHAFFFFTKHFPRHHHGGGKIKFQRRTVSACLAKNFPGPPLRFHSPKDNNHQARVLPLSAARIYVFGARREICWYSRHTERNSPSIWERAMPWEVQRRRRMLKYTQRIVSARCMLFSAAPPK